MTSILKTIRSDYLSLPWGIRLACFNLAILTIAWGLGTDTYLSIYLETLFGDIFWIGMYLATLSTIKLLLNLPIGELDGRIDERKIIIGGKILYCLSAITMFLAGYWQSITFLLLTLPLFGIAYPMVYTTYQSYLRQHSNRRNASQVFGLFNAEQAIAYCGAAIVTALIIPYFELHWFYVFVFLFSLVSIMGDINIPERRSRPIWPEIKRVLWKKNVYKKVYQDLKNYDSHFYFILFLQLMWGLMDYVSLMFIPLLAIQHDLTLSQTALVFGFMRLPYLLSFFFAEIADRRESLGLLGGSLLLAAGFLGIIGTSSSFAVIFFVSMAFSTCLAMIRPTIGGVLTNLIVPRQRCEMTGVEEFLSKGGQIIGSLVFGIMAHYFGMEWTFMSLASIIGITGLLTFHRRCQHDKNGRLNQLNQSLKH